MKLNLFGAVFKVPHTVKSKFFPVLPPLTKQDPCTSATLDQLTSPLSLKTSGPLHFLLSSPLGSYPHFKAQLKCLFFRADFPDPQPEVGLALPEPQNTMPTSALLRALYPHRTPTSVLSTLPGTPKCSQHLGLIDRENISRMEVGSETSRDGDQRRRHEETETETGGKDEDEHRDVIRRTAARERVSRRPAGPFPTARGRTVTVPLSRLLARRPGPGEVGRRGGGARARSGGHPRPRH